MDVQDGNWVDWLYMAKWTSLILFQAVFVVLVVLFSRLASVKKQLEQDRFLLVTAHPDDEVMFFFPFISSFVKTNEIGLLCLSTGDADGLGRVRTAELEKSARNLRLTRVTVSDDPLLRDGMQSFWDSQRIYELVMEEVAKHNYTALVTFDSYGVSGHANHIAIHSALSASVPSLKCFQLQSTNILRKYLGLLDLPLSSLGSFPVVNFNPFATWSAMAVHWSQFVWYRHLFVLFSRYSYLNTLERLS